MRPPSAFSFLFPVLRVECHMVLYRVVVCVPLRDGLIRKFFINGVANLLSIVGDCNCNGLLADHMERMEALYQEFMTVLKVPHADAFAMLPEDFHDVVFKGLASYGEHFPSTKMDFDAGLELEIDSLNGYVCMRLGG